MMKWLTDRIDNLLKILDSQYEVVRIVGLPSLLFILDFVLKSVLGLNLSDIGADMALISAASFASIIFDEYDNPNMKSSIPLILFIAFLIPWMFCLWSIKSQHPWNSISFGSRVYDTSLFPVVLSWLVGLLSLVFSTICVYVISKESAQ